jgi:hypothetical protein
MRIFIAVRAFRESGMLRKLIFSVVSTFMIASSAQAARLTDIEGTVLVNTGEGFQEVIGKTTVSPGDRVLVRGKGGAQIDYGAGCITKVLDNQTVVVAAKPACNITPVPSLKKFASLKEPPAIPPRSPVPMPFADGQAEKRILIVGGLVVVGTTIAAIVTNGNDNKDRSQAPKDGSSATYADDGAAIAWIGRGNEEGSSPAATNRAQVRAADLAAATSLTGGDNHDGTPASP